MRLGAILLLFVGLAVGKPLTDWKVWVSAQGSKVEARLLSLRYSQTDADYKLVLERPDGQRLNLFRRQLCRNDQQLVGELAKNKAEGARGMELVHHDPAKSRNRERSSESEEQKLEKSAMFFLPEGWSESRKNIPSRGESGDRASDYERAVANHIFWLESGGLANLGSSRDRDRIWKKALSIAKLRAGDGPRKMNFYPQAHLREMKEVLEAAEAPVTKLVLQGEMRPSLRNLRLAAEGTNFVMMSTHGQGEHRGGYFYHLPVLYVEGERVHVAYREERTFLTFEEVREGEDWEKGYWLRVDPADQSSLARSLRRDEKELFFDVFYVFSFQFEQGG